MIFVLFDTRDLLGLEEEIISHHFVNCASERENVSIATVFMPEKNLRRTILASLNIFSEVLVGETSITHIGNLEEKFVIEFDIDALPLENTHIDTILFVLPILFLFLLLFGSLLGRLGLFDLTTAVRGR
jgi:hypothetical protein